MHITSDQDKFYHGKLPIGNDEKIIGVYRHHVMAYILPVLLALSMILVIWVLVLSLTTNTTGDEGLTSVTGGMSEYIYYGAGIFSVLILVFTYIPVWIKMQEQIVLTDEALLQMLQTSLFSDKVSQLSLQHVADISARQGFWGNMFGFGKLTIETPGEQANYEFSFLSDPNAVAREVSEAHENFIAALESGRMKSNFRSAETMAPLVNSIQNQGAVSISPEEYRQFQAFQQMQRQASQDDSIPSQPQPTPPANQSAAWFSDDDTKATPQS